MQMNFTSDGNCQIVLGQLIANMYGLCTLSVLALTIITTKVFTVLCSWLLWALPLHLYTLMWLAKDVSVKAVFSETTTFEALEANSLGIPNPQSLPTALENCGHKDEDSSCQIPHYLVSDDAFSLTPNMMKPYPQRGLTEEQCIFNYRLSGVQRVNESAFGILSAKL